LTSTILEIAKYRRSAPIQGENRLGGEREWVSSEAVVDFDDELSARTKRKGPQRLLGRTLLAVAVGMMILAPVLSVLPSVKSDNIDEWTYEILDATDPALWDARIAVDSRGYVHVVNDNSSQYGLDYRTNEGGVWRSEFIPGPDIADADPYIVYASIAVDEGFKVHIGFTIWFDVNPFYGGSLLYATNSGGGWSTEIVDEGTKNECYRGDSPWIVINPEGSPQIFYLGSYHGDDYEESLRHATKVGSTWQIIEVNPVVVFAYDSLSHVMGPEGVSHVAGVQINPQTEERELTYATDSDGSWTSSVVIGGGVRSETSICLDPQGHPHIGVSWSNTSGTGSGNFVHSWMTDGSWNSETVYTNSNFETGENSSIASDSFGNMHAIYRGGLFMDIYSTNEGGVWRTILLNDDISYYSTNSLYSIAVDRFNTIHALYSEDLYGNCAILMYAFRETFPSFPIPYTLAMSDIADYPVAGVGQTVTVSVYDQFGMIYPNYTGTVHFSSNVTDNVHLPSDYEFQVSDQGQHTFSGEVTFLSEGWYTLNCVDVVDADLVASQNEIHAVKEPPVASCLEIGLPTWSDVGAPFSATVTVFNQYGGACESYEGTVAFTSSDPASILPEDYTFAISDMGVHEFTSAFVLMTNGTQTVTATDISDSTLSGTKDTYVAECEYAPQTIPSGQLVDFRMFESVIGPSYHIDSNPIKYGWPYEFFGRSLYNIEVGSSGGIFVCGYFSFFDALPNSQLTNYRNLFLYVLDADNSTILQKVKLLDYSDTLNTWHWRERIVTGFVPGDTVQIGIGRSQGYFPPNFPDYALTVEWVMVEAASLECVSPMMLPLEDVVTQRGKETTFRTWAWDLDPLASLSYTWDFGDGTPLVVGNPLNHVYTSIGVFGFTVYVDDGTGFNISSSAVATVTVPDGILKVLLNPAVPGMIYVNGDWTTRWGVENLPLPPGDYEISFGPAVGYVPPPARMVTVESGQMTTITAEYVEMAVLRVMTSPEVPSTIYVDGIARNDWGLWVCVPAGTYTVSFGAVSDYLPPEPVIVTLEPGQYEEVVGQFMSSPEAPGPDPSTYGLLRVTMSPAVPLTICVDGIWRTQFGIDWLKMSPGVHEISCDGIPFYGGLEPTSIIIVAGATTYFNLSVSTNPVIRIQTNPSVPTTMFVNGIARSLWGLWVEVPSAQWYEVSYGAVAGFVTPASTRFFLNGGESYVTEAIFDSVW